MPSHRWPQSWRDYEVLDIPGLGGMGKVYKSGRNRNFRTGGGSDEGVDAGLNSQELATGF